MDTAVLGMDTAVLELDTAVLGSTAARVQVDTAVLPSTASRVHGPILGLLGFARARPCTVARVPVHLPRPRFLMFFLLSSFPELFFFFYNSSSLD